MAPLHLQPLGPLVQLGFVVPSLDAAIDAWLERGVGPFFEMRKVVLREQLYRGAPTHIDMSVAITYSGETQIELIEARGTAPSVYADFLDAHPAGGLHHLAFLPSDFDAALGAALERGQKIEQDMTNAVGGRFVYLERDALTGTYIELLQAEPALLKLFAYMRKAAQSWDGATPRRPIG